MPRFKAILKFIIVYTIAGALFAMGLAPEQTIGKWLTNIFQQPPAYFTQNTARWIFVIAAVVIIIVVHLKWLLSKIRPRLSETQEQIILYLGEISSDFSAPYQSVLHECNIENKSKEQMHGERVKLERLGFIEYSSGVVRLTDEGYESYEKLEQQGKEFTPRESPELLEAKEPRDMSAWEVVTYVATQSELIVQVKSTNPFLDASHEFERAALSGEIEVKGRKEDSNEYEIIDRHHWETAELDLFECMNPDGTGGKTMAKGIDGTRGADDFIELRKFKPYIGLRVERSEVIELWPRSQALTESYEKWKRNQ